MTKSVRETTQDEKQQQHKQQQKQQQQQQQQQQKQQQQFNHSRSSVDKQTNFITTRTFRDTATGKL